MIEQIFGGINNDYTDIGQVRTQQGRRAISTVFMHQIDVLHINAKRSEQDCVESHAGLTMLRVFPLAGVHVGALEKYLLKIYWRIQD